MASAAQCRKALDRLAEALAGVDPAVRSKHLPQRTVLCRIKDLDVAFWGRLDEAGIHDIRQLAHDARDDAPPSDVRVTITSDDLVALIDGREDAVSAWLHGRLHVSAPVRDILRLRSLVGL